MELVKGSNYKGMELVKGWNYTSRDGTIMSRDGTSQGMELVKGWNYSQKKLFFLSSNSSYIAASRLMLLLKKPRHPSHEETP